jgi:MinD-like ATPase involved in chromosome partitioning or flagellar assembly
MAKIISVHSFRGGTGKSNTTANLATLLAADGNRVGVVDTDIQSPGIHILFGLRGEDIRASLNDYLWHGADIREVAEDVTPTDNGAFKGKMFLIPSSTKPGEISRVLREGYDAQKLTKGFGKLVESLSLDFLIIDTHPGLNEETLLSLVISNILMVVMRPDQQDYEGTGITIQVAQQLGVPHMMLIVNKAPLIFEPEAIKAKVEGTYGIPVVAVLAHSDDMLNLGSEAIFVQRFPNHPITEQYKQIVTKLMAM